MSAQADFIRLERELDQCLVDLFELARAADDEWRWLVEALGGSQPLPLANGAANPAEVRAVLMAVRGLYERRLQVVERDVARDDEPLVDAIWTFRHRRLAYFVEEHVAAYIKLVAPRPSIASAFGRATV